MYIMKLIPTGKDYIWGGTNLKKCFNKNVQLDPLAETWECSVHDDGPCYIQNGEFEGYTLKDLLKEHPGFMGESCNGEFPVLIKFIDAADDLSVQVHPSDEYALTHENQNGKTEMWYVLDAEEGASLVYGFKDNYTKTEIRNAIEKGTLMDCLNKVSVHKGDCFFIPSGTVHAIGHGILIAEIQQNSNLTYRVYDYDRTDKNGNKRELHIEKALEVMNLCPAPINKDKSDFYCDEAYSSELLCDCDYFKVSEYKIKKETALFVGKSSFAVILCINGNGTIHGVNSDLYFTKGDCLFIPADYGKCTIEGDNEIILVEK